MRSALSALTVRGRCFLVAGFLCVVAAVASGQRDLLRVGLFVMVLPAVAGFVVARTRYRLTCDRRLDPPRIPVGQSAAVTVRVQNVARLPTGVLLLEDGLPFLLGSRPRFVLDRVEAAGRRQVSYSVRPAIRGRYLIGPLSVRLTDPFGLSEMTRSFTTRTPLMVTPQVVPLPAIRLRADWLGDGESRLRSIARQGEDDSTTREYRDGDDLRRVHWRSTARCGQLMVRREEQPWQSRAALVVDLRARAHRGDGPQGSVEWVVTAAASIGVHLARAGYAVRAYDDRGEELTAAATQSGGAADDVLLDALAVAHPSAGQSLAPAMGVLRRSGEGLLVALLGAADPEEVATLARLRSGQQTAVAFLVDLSSWSAPGPRQQAAEQARFDVNLRLLSATGWRVLPVRRGDRLADLWPRAGRPTDRTAPPPPVDRLLVATR